MIDILGVQFKTKQAALERMFSYVHSLPMYTRLTHDPEKVMFALAARHPHYTDDWFYRIDHFTVITGTDMRVVVGKVKRAAPDQKSRAVCVHFKDGTSDGMSWRKCINGKDNSAQSHLQIAARDAVAGDIANWRKAHITTGGATAQCSRCRRHTPLYSVDIHHSGDMGFAKLLRLWVPIETVQFGPPQVIARGYSSTFADRAVHERWRTFHATNAKLEALCVTCHSAEHGRPLRFAGLPTPTH